MIELRGVRTLLLSSIAAAVCGLLAQHASSHPSIVFCPGNQVSGSFAAVPGSAGAGNIVYALRLKNHGTSACTLTGLPVVSLRGRYGKKLPTNVRSAHPGQATAVLVTLQPGRSASATARFSPDVPGPGEGHTGPCEPTAYRLVVTPNGGGSTSVLIRPRTPVCEHGRLSFSVYTAN